MWRDSIDLVSVSHSAGETVAVSETIRTVFANKKSVTRSEFYHAFTNNLKPTVVFEIRYFEYDDEQKIQHEGKDYLVLRTYSKNGETIDLVCQAYDDVQTNLASLRDMVEIWRTIFTENSMGEQTPSPELWCTVPAHVDYTGGFTDNVDGATETTNKLKVTIRYREGITPSMFMLINGHRHDIKFIEDPLNRHETLILSVERVVP
jgi:SPP1 family predicted phage head-tail adaptor